MQGTQGADGEIDLVGAFILTSLQGTPYLNDAIEQIHARHGAGDATTKAVDEQDASAAFKDFGLAVGGIAQGRQVGSEWGGFGLEEDFVGAKFFQEFYQHLQRDGLPDIG